MRPWSVLPFLPVVVVGAVVAVLRPGMIASGAGSWRAQLLGLGVAAAGGLAWLVVRRFSRVAAPWVSSAVLLALMAWVLAPSFRERTVVEAFPPVSSPAPVQAPSATPGTSAAPAPAVTAQLLSAGTFRGIDHSASGRGALYDVGGDVVVRFEGVAFQGTPKPTVRLVVRGKRSPDGGTRLGPLKGEKGSFSYPFPAGLDPAGGWTVLVWCDAFDVPIAAADLT